MEKHRPHDLANEGRHDARSRHVHGGDARLLRFTDDLLFRPDWQQVIYVEDGFHKDVNDFLNANYDAICGAMREAGFAFCYLPRLVQELRASGFVSYFTPYQDRAVGASPSSSRLMPYLAEGETMPHASLLVYETSASGDRGYAFSSFAMARLELLPLLNTLLPHLREKRKQKSDVRYSNTPMIQMPGEDYADECFDEETQNLMDEVREKIARLRQHGVSEMVFRQLLMPEMKLSRLHINERGAHPPSRLRRPGDKDDSARESRLPALPPPSHGHQVQVPAGLPRGTAAHL